MEVSTVISLGISIISIIFCIATFVRTGNKDIKQDTSKDSYKQGQLDTQLKQIFEKLDKIEAKLDGFDNEIDVRIEKAIKQHIEIWHEHHENA